MKTKDMTTKNFMFLRSLEEEFKKNKVSKQSQINLLKYYGFEETAKELENSEVKKNE